MYVFYDTEFTDLTKDADVISIGLITDGDQKFYGEITDFDHNKCSDFVKEQVLPNLGNPVLLPGGADIDDYVLSVGTKEKVSADLMSWLESQRQENENIYFVSDVCHYDFVLLIDLLTNGGSAIDLPNFISPVCEDVNALIADFMDASQFEAFDFSREEFLKDFLRIDVSKYASQKHNALFDAYVIREIYLFLIAEDLEF